MEEKKLTEKESLELISQMIRSTKQNMQMGNGNIFLFYGYMATFLSIAIYLLVYFTHNKLWSMGWLLMFAGWIAMSVKHSRNKPGVVTYTDKTIAETWRIIGSLFGLTFIIMCAMGGILGGINFSLMLPLSLLYACIGTSVTGIVIKEPWLIYTPLAGFVFAIYMLMSFSLQEGSHIIWNLYFGLSFIIMMIVPGHIINSKSKRLC